MLENFLSENRNEIFKNCEARAKRSRGNLANSDILKRALPNFYDQLLHVLHAHRSSKEETSLDRAKEEPNLNINTLVPIQEGLATANILNSAAINGEELLNLGYTISQVVHTYGELCQSVTEIAQRRKMHIDTSDYQAFNQCLDIAIAGAVSAYATHDQIKFSKSKPEVEMPLLFQETSHEVEDLAKLALDLRSTLATAKLAFEVVSRGIVDPRGNTARIVRRSLGHIGTLIDQTLSDIRIRIDPKLHIEVVNINKLIQDLLVLTESDGIERNQILTVDVDSNSEVKTDRQLMTSILSCFLSNAFKFTPPGGRIQIRGKMLNNFFCIEIEDECGGHPPDTSKEMGFGLSTAYRAANLCKGEIKVHNLPNEGCIYILNLPKAIPETHSK